MTKQESAALNEAADCERMHEQAEALYQKLSARFGIQDGE